VAGNQGVQRQTRPGVAPTARLDWQVGPQAAAGHEYFPGLDGLRAIAVVAVLFFHAGVRWVPGGFLGVSLFFTLSGFLITGLLIDEFSANGRIALRGFWARRIRRLMPAALVCLALVLIASRWLVDRAAISSLRTDVVAAAADVANWRFVTAHQSYAELFAHQPSALLHFWSLAIEEQFYLLFPCVVAVLASRRRPWLLPVGLLGLLVASVSATLLTSSHDTIYYGTHTRAAELLIGGLLAWFVRSRANVGAPTNRPLIHLLGHRVPIVQAAGYVGLGLFALFVVTTRQADDWLYRGGFVMLALLWCVLIVAARANGSFRALVSVPPLVALGRRSYGVYLFHWPVFVLVTPSRLGVHGWQARLVQLAIIAVVT
jgi:peptidoglycan/LPS O-acetylase OafA/YrhL